jgi:hypothetical protein
LLLKMSGQKWNLILSEQRQTEKRSYFRQSFVSRAQPSVAVPTSIAIGVRIKEGRGWEEVFALQ